ncbi:cardiolipin synthase [Geomicrobium sp. JCM 19055]|uniref:cardiolipin synthase n=1 Tax=Geomicrobium sp. JCM 19055 TaxID=1460649 RepID=UPI0005A99B34|nr:cardiolipin synthase [Geomicrobium sp. JCM 19055]
MSFITGTFSIVLLINILLAFIIVFIERRDIGATWAWILILFFIPIGGFILYLIFGRHLKQKNFYNLSKEEREYLKIAVEAQVYHLQQHLSVFQDQKLQDKYEQLMLINLQSSTSIITTDNEVELFTEGKTKFDELFHDIRQAKEEINIQYYIIQRDELGIKLRDELTAKAKEGVKVRLLYDDIGSRRLNRSFFKELIEHNGEVAAFFPSIFKVVNLRINNRNHRKLCIIDGDIGYIGGFNVGREYLGKKKKFGYWRDTHFRIRGGAVDHIHGRFILDWKQATKQDSINLSEYAGRKERHSGSSPVQIVDSGPNSETEHLKNMYIKLIMTAKKSIKIQTPYFIPDTSFMDAIKIALLSNVDVHIMIPNKPDHPFVYWATLAHVGELLKYGANVWIYEKGFMHAKTIVIDEEVCSVGTTNIDSRSFRLNFEVNATVYDEAVAQKLHNLFLDDMKDSTLLTPQLYKERSLWIKIKEAVSRLLSPIL